MPITALYPDYHSKSRTFFLPFIGIHKSSPIRPVSTHLSWPQLSITPEDRRLLLVYQSAKTDTYLRFEAINLLSNALYQESYRIVGDKTVYIFNFESFPADWDFFLSGRYSKMSVTLKNLIASYYGKSSGEYAYIETYLYPEKFFELYSRLLYDEKDRDYGLQLITKVGELCNKPDLIKETCNELILDNPSKYSTFTLHKQRED